MRESSIEDPYANTQMRSTMINIRPSAHKISQKKVAQFNQTLRARKNISYGQRTSAFGSHYLRRSRQEDSSGVTFDSTLTPSLSRIALSKNKPVPLDSIFGAENRRPLPQRQETNESRSIEVARWKTSNLAA